MRGAGQRRTAFVSKGQDDRESSMPLSAGMVHAGCATRDTLPAGKVSRLTKAHCR